MMAVAQGGEPALRVRLWPGVIIVLLLWSIRFGLPAFVPEAMMAAVLAELLGGLAVLIWWAFFSRWPHIERWGALLLVVLAFFATAQFLDRSIATGMMGMMYLGYAIPVVCLALVAAAAAGRRLAPGPRRATLAAMILVACGAFGLLRTEGVDAAGRSEFAWRWSQTHEQKLLAHTAVEPVAPPVAVPAGSPATPPVPAATPPPLPRAAVRTVAAWPGFRGPHRDGIVTGVRISTDWAASPPVKLWRRPVGPGWSSFAAGAGLLYTQEQRGEFELVSCYNSATGQPVWVHRDTTRFWESNAGAGPRATPALRDGRVYAFGATGILNALDARSGAVVWTRNPASDTGAKIPIWGFSSSPLPLDDVVIVAVAGRLAAYDRATGDPRWQGPDGGSSYSSPHLLTIEGSPQVVLLSNDGAVSLSPSDGRALWKHAWRGSSIVQPALTEEGAVLIAAVSDSGAGIGTRRLQVTQGEGEWTAREIWTSTGLKPYFNDFVTHHGHAFGFDGSILACIGLQDGKRKWKGGRYGNGQLILLADQDVLLVLSEEGELALVAATTGQFTELARVPAIEGKTWNHPALLGDILLVRNDREMAAFRLPLAER